MIKNLSSFIPCLLCLFIFTSCGESFKASNNQISEAPSNDSGIINENGPDESTENSDELTCTDKDQIIKNNQTQERTRYFSNTASDIKNCRSEIQQRTCQNGKLSAWSGTAQHESCSALKACASGGKVYADGQKETRTRFLAGTVKAPATCQKQTQNRTCKDGKFSAWSGTAQFTQCLVLRSCTSEDKVYADGQKETRTRFLAGTVKAPATCQTQTQNRTCKDGKFSAWSGTAQFTRCLVLKSCTSEGKVYADGQKETRNRFLAAQVTAPAACQKQTQNRTCKDGKFSAWSGTATHLNCVVNQPKKARVLVDGQLFDLRRTENNRWLSWDPGTSEVIFLGRDSVSEPDPLEFNLRILNPSSSEVSLQLIRNPNGFLVLNKLPSRLPANKSTDISFALDRKKIGIKEGTFSFRINSETYEINLKGEVVQ